MFTLFPNSGALKLVKDHSGEPLANQINEFCTPDGNGVELENELKNLKYGDYVILTILKAPVETVGE